METTTKTLSRQQVAAMLRKAGFDISSEGSSGRVSSLATRSPGISVLDNGHIVYICKRCSGVTNHNGGCRATGAAKNWRQRKVKDGTVTVEIHVRTMGFTTDADRAKRQNDADRLAAFVAEQGLTIEENGSFRWILSA